jgi:hypothetical protein
MFGATLAPPVAAKRLPRRRGCRRRHFNDRDRHAQFPTTFAQGAERQWIGPCYGRGMNEPIDTEGLVILAIVAGSIAPLVLLGFWLFLTFS